MSETILINRYASRRLYNTQTSEYVTLEEIAGLVRDGSDVEIKDRKTGEDLTRQYLLQIITEQESKGENVLPINVLTGLVRSYSTATQAMLPEFLSKSYDMFNQQQTSMMEKFAGTLPEGLSPTMGLGAAGDWQKQQTEMVKSMMQAWMPQMHNPAATQPEESDSRELSEVKAQLAELMKKVNGL